MLLIVADFAAIAWVLVKWDERKHVRQGYWVEHLSPGQLRANEDTFAVVYHELERWQFFSGKIGTEGKPDQLSFPDDAVWQAQAPDWLNRKRELVLSRILGGLKRIEIVIVPQFPPS